MLRGVQDMVLLRLRVWRWVQEEAKKHYVVAETEVVGLAGVVSPCCWCWRKIREQVVCAPARIPDSGWNGLQLSAHDGSRI